MAEKEAVEAGDKPAALDKAVVLLKDKRVAVPLFFLFLVLYLYFVYETPDEYAARLAREKCGVSVAEFPNYTAWYYNESNDYLIIFNTGEFYGKAFWTSVNMSNTSHIECFLDNGSYWESYDEMVNAYLVHKKKYAENYEFYLNETIERLGGEALNESQFIEVLNDTDVPVIVFPMLP